MTTIHVTEEDIAKGDFAACPIDHAIRRQTIWKRAMTGRVSIWEMGDSCEHKLMPGTAVKFAKDFDDSAPVSPFSFEIDIPKAPETARS